MRRGAVQVGPPGGVTSAYDLDGWRLEELEDGDHVVHLRLGQGFLIHALVACASDPGRWKLLLVDSAVYHVDEIEVELDPADFACPPLELPLPAGARVELRPGGAVPLLRAQLRAERAPLRLELGLELEGGERLVLTERHPWLRLDREGRVLGEQVSFGVAIDERA